MASQPAGHWDTCVRLWSTSSSGADTPRYTSRAPDSETHQWLAAWEGPSPRRMLPPAVCCGEGHGVKHRRQFRTRAPLQAGISTGALPCCQAAARGAEPVLRWGAHGRVPGFRGRGTSRKQHSQNHGHESGFLGATARQGKVTDIHRWVLVSLNARGEPPRRRGPLCVAPFRSSSRFRPPALVHSESPPAAESALVPSDILSVTARFPTGPSPGPLCAPGPADADAQRLTCGPSRAASGPALPAFTFRHDQCRSSETKHLFSRRGSWLALVVKCRYLVSAQGVISGW